MRKARVVLGAGISGLTTAFYLKKLFPHDRLIVLEAENRVGGWVASQRLDGYFFEKGPRGLKPHPSVQDIVEALDLTSEVIAADKACGRRMLWCRGKMRSLPSHPLQALFSPLLWPALPALFKEWSVPKTQIEESVRDFFKRRFNAYVADYLAGAMVQGIYAGLPENLSLKACFPRLYRSEQTYGSLSKAFYKRTKKRLPSPFDAPLISLRGGMGRLTQALYEKVAKECQLGIAVQKIESLPGGIGLKAQNDSYFADELYACVGAASLRRLIEDKPIGALLEKFSSKSLTLVHIGFEEAILPAAFGYLTIPCEKAEVLGATVDSATFPQFNRYPAEGRLTVMMPLTEDNAEERALKAVALHLNCRLIPSIIGVTHANGAIPQYDLSHFQNLKALQAVCKERFPSLKLLGSSFQGVSVADNIQSVMDTLGVSRVEQRRR